MVKCTDPVLHDTHVLTNRTKLFFTGSLNTDRLRCHTAKPYVANLRICSIRDLLLRQWLSTGITKAHEQNQTDVREVSRIERSSATMKGSCWKIRLTFHRRKCKSWTPNVAQRLCHHPCIPKVFLQHKQIQNKLNLNNKLFPTSQAKAWKLNFTVPLATQTGFFQTFVSFQTKGTKSSQLNNFGFFHSDHSEDYRNHVTSA